MKTVPSRARRTFALFLSLGLIYAAAFCSNRSFAFSLDDFNDNAKDASKWGMDAVFGHGVLTETNQRLEYTCGLPSIPEDLSDRPWVFTRFPYDTDWEIQIDTVNTTAPLLSFQVNSSGITIHSPHNALDDVYLELYSSSLGGPPARRGFNAQLEINGVTQGGGGDTGEAFTTTGAVRMTFNSTTKVLTCFYDADPADGYQWIELASFGLAGSGGATADADFAMTDTDQFSLTLYGYSAGMIVTSGQIFMDNLKEIGGVVPSGPPSPVPLGSFPFGFPTNNPLLTAIVDISGNYQGVAPRNYSIDAAQDETGKLAIMGTMDGVKDGTGSSDVSTNIGAIQTVNGKPTAQLSSTFTGTRDDVSVTASGAAVVPVEVADVGSGAQGAAGTGSYTSNVGGMAFGESNVPLKVTAPPGAVDNLKKDWSIRLDIRASAPKGKGKGKSKGKSKGQSVSAELLLPNGDTIAYPERTLKSSKKKGFSLSFTNGTNVTRNPAVIDNQSSITITGLKFVQQGTGWQASAGMITYHFLGQQGTANLLDFVGP